MKVAEGVIVGFSQFGIYLDISGKRKFQLGNGLRQIDLWGISLILIDEGGPSPLWVVPALGRRAWAVVEPYLTMCLEASQ